MTKFINLITIIRILLAPVIFLFLIFNNYILCLIFFFLAGITDFFDGYLARKYKSESELGEILDPIADKILIVSMFFGLAVNFSSYLIGFIGSIIVAREIWVSALRDYNARNNSTNATKVMFIGKIKTATQIFTITIYLLGLALNKMLLIVIADIFLIISLFVTLYSGYLYTINTFNKIK